MRPDEKELRETIARMEARLRAEPLFGDYERICARFEADLEDERDVLLSRAAALMLLQERASPSSDS